MAGQRLLAGLFLFLIAASFVLADCSSKVATIPANCTGTITQDTVKGSCRTILCETGANSVKVQACDKPDTTAKQFFEMNKQSSTGTTPDLCIGSTCIQNNGYAKSANYPFCFNQTNSTGNQTNTTLPPTNQTNTTLPPTNQTNSTGNQTNTTLPPTNQTNSTGNQTNATVTVCYTSSKTIPVNCTATITQDTFSGCRIVLCSNSSGSVKIQACDKPGFFELSKQSATGAQLRVCFGPTCIKAEGYVKSTNFPICINATNQTSSNQTNTTGPPNTSNQTNSTGNQTNTTGQFQESLFVGTLNTPTAITFSPDGRLFVSQKIGKVKIVKNGVLQSASFFDQPVDTDGEHGVMGVTFDPDFDNNHYVYIFYSPNSTKQDRLSRFTDDNGIGVNETILLDNIPTDFNIHDAGAIHFGPDGMLYVTVGDGGNSSNAQNLGTWQGKILRLFSNGTAASDNPFVNDTEAKPEVWALGLRNPFTFAFDGSRMLVNDVGENTWEEINVGAAGANYGWPICEGNCAVENMTNPIYQYPTNPSAAIVGSAFLNGDYYFADYEKGFIKKLTPSNQVITIATNKTTIVDVAIGPDHNLYWASISQGKVYKITLN